MLNTFGIRRSLMMWIRMRRIAYLVITHPPLICGNFEALVSGRRKVRVLRAGSYVYLLFMQVYSKMAT